MLYRKTCGLVEKKRHHSCDGTKERDDIVADDQYSHAVIKKLRITQRQAVRNQY